MLRAGWRLPGAVVGHRERNELYAPMTVAPTVGSPVNALSPAVPSAARLSRRPSASPASETISKTARTGAALAVRTQGFGCREPAAGPYGGGTGGDQGRIPARGLSRSAACSTAKDSRCSDETGPVDCSQAARTQARHPDPDARRVGGADWVPIGLRGVRVSGDTAAGSDPR